MHPQSNHPDGRLWRWLTGAGLALGLLAFALTVPMTYLKLHLFVSLPALWFVTAPPGVLPWASPELRRWAYVLPFGLCVAAVSFSAFWDNFIFSRGVFTFDKDTMVGTFMHLPLEEWFWFIDHTLFSSFFLYFITGPEQRSDANGTSVRRVSDATMGMVMVVSAAVTLMGIWFMNQDNSHLLFLGVNLGFMFPVLAIQWWFGLHILLDNKMLWAVGVLAPAAYLLGLDYWALQVNIWHLSPEYITGIKIGDVYFEQILIYTLPSVLVTQSALIMLRQIERVEARRQAGETLDRAAVMQLILKRDL